MIWVLAQYTEIWFTWFPHGFEYNELKNKYVTMSDQIKVVESQRGAPLLNLNAGFSYTLRHRNKDSCRCFRYKKESTHQQLMWRLQQSFEKEPQSPIWTFSSSYWYHRKSKQIHTETLIMQRSEGDIQPAKKLKRDV